MAESPLSLAAIGGEDVTFWCGTVSSNVARLVTLPAVVVLGVAKGVLTVLNDLAELRSQTGTKQIGQSFVTARQLLGFEMSCWSGVPIDHGRVRAMTSGGGWCT